MKLIFIAFVALCMSSSEVFAGKNAELSFYNQGQLVSSRAMTKGELKSFEALQVSNQVVAIIDKRNGQSNADTKKTIDKLLENKEVAKGLKQALNTISLSLEFDIKASDYESTTLSAYSERYLKASADFKNDISAQTQFTYDEVRVAGKKLF